MVGVGIRGELQSAFRVERSIDFSRPMNADAERGQERLVGGR